MEQMQNQADTRKPMMVLAVLLAVAVFPPRVAAATNPPPDLIAYQGRIHLANGSTAINGVFDIEFYLYDAVVEGSVLWAERHEAVQVSRGMFSVLLGAGASVPLGFDEGHHPHGTLATVFESDEVYIGLKVGEGEPFMVRQRFATAPHALRVQNAFKAVHGVPPGTIMPFAGTAVPEGWKVCDGAALSRTDFNPLFLAIGTKWGNGDGTNTFNVPDLGGRIPVGASPSNPDQANGKHGGEEMHALTEAEMPLHKHHYKDRKHDGSMNASGGAGTWVAENSEGERWQGTDFVGGNQPHNNIQPSIVVKYIIKW